MSTFVHVLGLCGLFGAWLFSVDPVPEPPIVIRFFVAPPSAPPVPPVQEMQADTPPPSPPDRRPMIARQAPPGPHEPQVPELQTTEEMAAREPESPPEPPAPATTRAAAPFGSLGPGSVGVFASLSTSRGEAPDPDLAPPPAGRATTGIAGAKLSRRTGGPVLSPDAIRPRGSLFGGAAASGRPPGSGGDAAVPDRARGANGGDAAVLLGRRYSVHLVNARTLGQSTHDGWRYNLLLPMLSEAYRQAIVLGHGQLAGQMADEEIASVRIDPDAIAIHYRDGTHHVIAPTRDGLVALFVSTGREGRSKVEEGQRALGVLRHLLRDRVRS